MSAAHPTDWSTHTQPVVLDIGDDVGALVLYAPPEMHGHEIEVSPSGDAARRVHSAVLMRRLGPRTIFAAVYAELAAGEYRIWGGAPGLPDAVTILPGRVAEVSWAERADGSTRPAVSG